MVGEGRCLKLTRELERDTAEYKCLVLLNFLLVLLD